MIYFIGLILILFYYIKKRYGFWYYQPVFHLYDVHYFLLSKSIIQINLPRKNHFVDEENILTISVSNMNKMRKREWIQFIQINYLQNKENVFLPNEENIIPYFKHFEMSCFLSYLIENHKMIGSITSRPLQISIHQKNDIRFDFFVYYVDYLCVDKQERKKGIAPKLIQTHEYKQRHLNQKIKVSVFKREEEITGIIPICIYQTYGFVIPKKLKMNKNESISIFLINKENFEFIYPMIEKNVKKFDLFMMTSKENLLCLIETKNIYITFSIHENQIQSIHFFRNSCVCLKRNEFVLSCFASIQINSNQYLFQQGFLKSLKLIKKKYPIYNFLAIESISDNELLIEFMMENQKPFVQSPTAYFFYNFIHPSYSSKNVFILN